MGVAKPKEKPLKISVSVPFQGVRPSRKVPGRGKLKNGAGEGSPTASDWYSAAGAVGLESSDVADIVLRLQKGLPFSSFTKFVTASGLTPAAAYTAIGLSAGKIRSRQSRGTLGSAESEGLYRLSRIFQLAVDLFEGNRDAARKWLVTAKPALGNSTPLQFASSEAGAREVEALIGRLENGIPS